MKKTVVIAGAAPRIDQWLHRRFPETSRSTWQRLIREGQVLLRGSPCVCRASIKDGDAVTIAFPAAKPSAVEAEAMPLDVLFEDDHLLVVNKPPGVVVHPGAGHAEHTLVSGILHHCRGQLSGIGGVERPGIVHRLDKDTSGCLVVAKTDAAHQELVRAFHDREVRKTYLAVVQGSPRGCSGRIEQPIGRHPVHRKKMSVSEKGRVARTDWKVAESLGAFTLVECHPLTGRTHQIRVHLASIGHPVAGDSLYGRKNSESRSLSVPRQMLHAWRLAFHHPVRKIPVSCEAPLPDDMRGLIELLRKTVKL
jgi:23S rRNA pseudouridine1911/1915/1917 synthase